MRAFTADRAKNDSSFAEPTAGRTKLDGEHVDERCRPFAHLRFSKFRGVMLVEQVPE